MDNEFCKVTRKKFIAYRSSQRRIKRDLYESSDEDYPDVYVEKFVMKIEKCCKRMLQSDYFIRCVKVVEEGLDKLEAGVEKDLQASYVERLVCFGIGSFTRNFQALHQLAFILSLQKHFNITDAVYFDPIFRKSEIELLEKFHCLVMRENCEGKYAAEVPTIFYLPHCSNFLTNNLLWRNWRRKQLKNVILINNSFEMLSCRKPERLLRSDSSYILDSIPYTKELALNDNYDVRNVFNDLSIHIFPAGGLPPSDSKFWEEKEAPKYSNVEFISANFGKINLE